MINPLIRVYFMEFHQNLLDIYVYFRKYLNVKIVYITKLRDLTWTFVIQKSSLSLYSWSNPWMVGKYAGFIILDHTKYPFPTVYKRIPWVRWVVRDP